MKTWNFSPLIMRFKNQPFLSYLEQTDILLIVYIKKLFGIRVGQLHFFAKELWTIFQIQLRIPTIS